MQLPEISERLRAEIYNALLDRSEWLTKAKKAATDKHAKSAAEGYEELLELYRDRSDDAGDVVIRTPGLLSIFAPEGKSPGEVDAERDESGQQDIFGGGTEVGGRPTGDPGEPETWANGQGNIPEPGDEPETRDSHLLPEGSSAEAGERCTHGVLLTEPCEACKAEYGEDVRWTQADEASTQQAAAAGIGAHPHETPAAAEAEPDLSNVQISRSETWIDPRRSVETATVPTDSGVGPEPDL